ncbi:MAG: hypothetical protein JKP95_01305 [Oceanicaulis sp.]|nr:hypothetical protein [Oceanicaulis sp.]
MLTNVATSQIVQLAETDMDAAASLWRSTVVVAAGLGGGNEITGGLWIVLLSLAGFQSRTLPFRSICWAGGGGAGIASTTPVLSDAAMIFGLGFIVWFFVVGVALLVMKPEPATA